jgi:hypothetical protein
MSKGKRLASLAGLAALSVVVLTAMPGTAKAWWAAGGGWGWHGGWCCGVGIGVVVPPVVVAPPPVYVAPPPAYYPPPPAYYPSPQQTWVPGHYVNGYWVPGHWI